MKNLNYQDFLNDPQTVMQHVHRESNRQRALAVSAHVFKPLARLCGSLLAIRGVKFRLDPRTTLARGVFQ